MFTGALAAARAALAAKQTVTAPAPAMAPDSSPAVNLIADPMLNAQRNIIPAPAPAMSAPVQDAPAPLAKANVTTALKNFDWHKWAPWIILAAIVLAVVLTGQKRRRAATE